MPLGGETTYFLRNFPFEKYFRSLEHPPFPLLTGTQCSFNVVSPKRKVSLICTMFSIDLKTSSGGKLSRSSHDTNIGRLIIELQDFNVSPKYASCGMSDIRRSEAKVSSSVTRFSKCIMPTPLCDTEICRPCIRKRRQYCFWHDTILNVAPLLLLELLLLALLLLLLLLACLPEPDISLGCTRGGVQYFQACAVLPLLS